MSDINIVLENRDDIHVAVEEKDINVEVPAGKDGRALHPRGEWSASAAYAYLDLVSYQGSSYVALKAVPAGILPTDTSYWMLSAEKGEPGGAVWGNIAGDLSDQTDLADALLAKAPVILSNVSGSIASFTDGSASPVTALSVAIEPVQDLHGYDNPWPAGGGKNLFDPSKAEVGKNWNGNAMAYSIVTDYIPVTVGNTYVFSVSNMQKYTGVVTAFFDADKTYISTGTSTTINPSGNETFVRVSIRCANTDTWTDTDLANAKIQIEKGSSATSWAPYSNICPISGHTSATVTRTEKNLCDPNEVELGKSYNGTANAKRCVLYKKFPTGTYTASLTNYQNFTEIVFGSAVAQYDRTNSQAQNIVAISQNFYTFTIDDTRPYFYFFAINTNDVTLADVQAINVQLERSSTATAYEAPSIQIVTIDLNGTRYGGVLNVLTGEMTVNRAIVDLGTLTWEKQTIDSDINFRTRIDDFKLIPDSELAKMVCSAYKTVTSFDITHSFVNGTIASRSPTIPGLRVCDHRYYESTAEEFKTAVSGVQCVYELATPLTVQLTPSTMQTLLGQNNLWADTGDTSVTYRADTKLFVQGQIAQTAKVTRQMIADSATADGKAPKSLATGDLIIVGDELRKATANIGNGSAITASNSTTATLADVIKALQ